MKIFCTKEVLYLIFQKVERNFLHNFFDIGNKEVQLQHKIVYKNIKRK